MKIPILSNFGRPQSAGRLSSCSNIWTALAIATLILGSTAQSCGPFFPNWLLADGDAAVLVAPVAQFQKELNRLGFANPQPTPNAPGTTLREQETSALDLELIDLKNALKQSGLQDPDHPNALALEQWTTFRKAFPLHTSLRQATEIPPSMTSESLAGLPAEFIDYAEGVIALRKASTAEAHTAWKRLLERPDKDRRQKSVWAAYMLGRLHSLDDTPTEETAAYFQQSRSLAQNGFSDSQNLAVESLGWEARLHLNAKQFHLAIPLYLDQLKNNDATATMSLYQTAAKALQEADDDVLVKIAKDPTLRKVISAYAISDQSRYYEDRENYSDFRQRVGRWLTAAESAEVKDLPSAEILALAAYRSGDYRSARRWILLAPGSTLGQWLTAKLWLKAGNLQKSCQLLKGLVQAFPREERNPQSPIHALGLPESEYDYQPIPASRYVQGELGVLLLARREYTEALHALLMGDFWMDAAYVAERVLTLPELTRYVESRWPGEPPAPPDPSHPSTPEELERSQIHRSIHALLARRMFREGRGRDAIPYLSESLQGSGRELVKSLDLAYSTTASQSERAQAWWAAAQLSRTNGMELLGTEVEPDWAVHDGMFQAGVTVNDRKNDTNSVARASKDELQRAARHEVDPEERFHYRYLAAAMAWEAAKLMPNNNEETAEVLCTAGGWLKNRDPKAADAFYKALVKRCPKTELGQEAKRLRWFPKR